MPNRPPSCHRSLSLALAACVGGALPSVAQPLAFPGAQGFGAESVGGRGGRVIEVTSLDDKVANPPEGTLRYALEASGARIVVFRIGGTFEPIVKYKITNPFITVAGHTAPGGGITIKGSPLTIEGAHDVILRGIRVRTGVTTLPETDALVINNGAFDVMVDHCSFSWSTDEVVDINGSARNITIQGSILSEGLDCSVHPDGCHSMGMLISSGARDITLVHNLIAHNNQRNPRMFGDGLGGLIATYDFYNNVVYDWDDWAASAAGASRVNVQGNHFKLGPSNTTYPDYTEVITQNEVPELRVWVEGNRGPSCPSGCGTADDWDQMVSHASDDNRAAQRNAAPNATITLAADAWTWVIAEAGASYRLDANGARRPRRDAVDRRVIQQLRRGTGGIIDDPAEVGGWPQLPPGVAPVDTDVDGMPDAWENLHGLDPFNGADGNGDLDGDGYTNVEEFLNETGPRSAD